MKKATKKKATSKRKSTKRKQSIPKPISNRRQEQEWQAGQDLETLKRAEEIRRDKARIKRAQNHADKEMAALQRAKRSTQ